jgi:hypothetical protein
MSVKETESFKVFKKICDNLPYNRNSIFCHIYLEQSRCDVYIPLRDNLVHNAEQARGFYQELCNAAEL